MKNKIKYCQQRLFYNLFATLPSIKKTVDFNGDFELDLKINAFYYNSTKNFWFTRTEYKNKYLFLFGLRNKSLKKIRAKDASLILDFDKTIQFNNECLGIFAVENSDIHILINKEVLMKRYPNISLNDFKIKNVELTDDSLNVEVIDMGILDDEFIINMEKLINNCNTVYPHKIKSRPVEDSSDCCAICSKNKNVFKIDSNLIHLRNQKPDLCGKCIEKIVVSEFYTKIAPLLNGNGIKELNVAKEKFGNDQLFEIGLRLLEKYEIIKYIGVKKLFYTIDKNSYLVNKYLKYSDENNLLLDKIIKKNYQKSDIVIPQKLQIPKVIKSGSDGNDIVVNQMNNILEYMAKGKSEKESIAHANVSKNKYDYWINRGKQNIGDIYVQFYNLIFEFRSKQNENFEKPEKTFVDEGIYEPILPEYEKLFSSMNESGIAWVTQSENFWSYLRKINGKSIKLSARTLPELYEKVMEQNLIWGIRDYDKAKKFIDIPDDFEIPIMVMENEIDENLLGIYNPLSEEYEKSFSSMNKTGIAWVNQIGNKFYYSKFINGKNIRLSGKNIYELYKKVKKANHVWGIRDYDKANKFIDIPDDFEIPPNPKIEENTMDVNEDAGPEIYAPLSEEYEKSFNSINRTGIAWVNKIGKRWVYTKNINGKTIKFDDENIYNLFLKVKKANHVWGIRDYGKAKRFIDIPDDFEIPSKPQIKESDDDIPLEIDPDIYAPLADEYEISYNAVNQTGIAWVTLIGKNWVYQRTMNKNKVYIKDKSLYNLHHKIKENNLPWGIKDYNKAKKFIDIPEDFVIPKKSDEIIEIDSDIYAPLPEVYRSSFNPGQKNRTGIAWVNKIGRKWVYQRKVNGVSIKFTDTNIRKLHDTVINNNQIWGIMDFDIAVPIIQSNSLSKSESKSETNPKPVLKSKVVVNYIDKSIDKIDIIIKGTIQNKDLIDVLNKLNFFKENIKRIMMTAILSDADVLIELEINKFYKHKFEEIIDDLGWAINK